ncbi:DUF4870 domain-containing protein [Amnibacterium kyonggiense]|uniref:Tic20 family protein n=1 Tax=Amnibacterium kyonggiense TaxID=595671 RepID=A0A4R7FMC7_9MICO|nr:DUF4870 domain-containing protein [Amnibacterium kyonggiense]TDS77625.1 hypothetical protein CLV52_2583 [Amnibacterium kyonggiense]
MTDDLRTTRPLSDHDARLWATLTHVSALIGIVVGAGFIGWLGPLIILLVLKDRSAFVADHAKTTLNFQITMFIVAVIAAATWIILVGFLLTAAVYVVVIVFSIIAAVAADRGQRYEYPLTIRFIR